MEIDDGMDDDTISLEDSEVDDESISNDVDINIDSNDEENID